MPNLPISEGVELPLEEIELRVSRSSGPGGQHANVTASRVEAIFDVHASQALSEAQRERICSRLGGRVTAVAQDTRSQAAADARLLILRERLRGVDVEDRLDPRRGHVRVLPARPRGARNPQLDLLERHFDVFTNRQIGHDR